MAVGRIRDVISHRKDKWFAADPLCFKKKKKKQKTFFWHVSTEVMAFINSVNIKKCVCVEGYKSGDYIMLHYILKNGHEPLPNQFTSLIVH